VRTGSKKGVLYVGHIPHGFFENQMRSFFKQFGNVTQLRISRSKRTGGSKGYAFIEFEYAEVAKVAADTMNNYLMFEKLLKCKYTSIN
jgi:nucleolar protein 15